MNDMKTADKVLYICNREKCEDCTASEGMCQHTSDVEYAANFVKIDDDVYMETEVARLVTKDEPERPKGEWIRTALWGQTCLKCNRCGMADFDITYDNFCPNCGAEMKSFKDCTELHKES